MELKVWVEGVARVVCGLNLDTSCQDVVIALAQAIGQTGRYVLIQKLRGTERQLMANDCPLRSLAYLGQMASEVQYILHRTGPSHGDGPNGLNPERVNQLFRKAELPPSKHTEPHKALTFNLGPSTVPRKTKTTRTWPPSPRASPEPRASTVSPHPAFTSPTAPSKEEVFREVLQQQDMVRKLEAQFKDLEREAQGWERFSTPVTDLTNDRKEEVEELEWRFEKNEEELEQEEYWEEQLQKESEKEREMDRQLGQIRRSLDDYSYRLEDLQTNSARLSWDITLEAQRQSSDLIQKEKALASLKEELHSRQQHGAELEALLAEKERDLQAADARIKDRCMGMEELNKELRQCNLQQFILQTGVPLAPSQDDLPQLPMHTNPPETFYLHSAGIIEEDQMEPVSVC